MDKIVIITTNIAPYRLRWSEELSEHYEVVIYYTKDREKDRDKRFLKHGSEKCKVVKLNNKNDRSEPLCFDVLKAIRQHRKDLILFDGYGPITNILGLVYCKLIRKKVIINVDGYALGEKPSFLKENLKKLIISKLCPIIFCSSEVTKEHLISCGADRDHIYVHNFSSVDRARILSKPLTEKEKEELREKLKIESRKPVVLGVGQFIPRKRFEDLIEAVKKCKTDCDLYILGGRPDEKYLELVKNTDKIRFIDFVPPEEVDDYYRASDLFVLCSQTDVWGLVLNEAVANGLPVISSDHCIAGLSMVEGNGIVYETGNIEQLTAAIDTCLEQENRKKMAERSLKIAGEYNIESMVERQLPVIQQYFENKL